MSVPQRAVQLTEPSEFLKEHPEVQFVDLLIADMNGVVRGKRIERNSLNKVFEKGINLPASLFALDITGSTVESTGLGLDIGDKGDVRGVDWGFNAWGGFEGGLYFPWQRDDQVARKILEIERRARYRTDDFVLEGGSIHVDGEGTLITTEECLLNHNRNPHLSQAEIERTLRDYLAVESIIWLPNGLYNDETDGHVDNFCCYVRPGEVLLAWTDDQDDPNYLRCQAALRVLEESRDAKGRKLVVHKMPIPGPLYATQEECDGVDIVEGSQPRDPSIRLAGSYVNFLIVNGGIIAPSFDDPKDAEARAILQRVFPEHEVVMVPGREVLLGGGNIHCITQQQPAPRKA
ncbi:agmatine deiminase [Pseudomonas aeruginosa]|uniref:agmatine deiminase n=1 Tax=Pseudomonas aeruginosa TaxID=287 RepID=UPI0009378CB0|nr:agmatine deiminase [Pseudomonas aeruginosa]